MRPVIGQCPVCQGTLHVTQLHCRECDTTIEGHFALGRLYQLSPEQLEFAEIFIRCEGKITRVDGRGTHQWQTGGWPAPATYGGQMASAAYGT